DPRDLDAWLPAARAAVDGLLTAERGSDTLGARTIA
ncbi:MAG: hypothetical protein QOJ82_2994, partial [Solirubrobacteraceae bacterium]|nr:hypothetical protein [Solirubrobacteraceae bacterium]